jgi:hypothetical protein
MQNFVNFAHYYLEATEDAPSLFVNPAIQDTADFLYDMYKDVHGFRPRWMLRKWYASTMEELDQEYYWLKEESRYQEERLEEERIYWEEKEAEELARAEEDRDSAWNYRMAELVGGRDSGFAPFWR